MRAETSGGLESDGAAFHKLGSPAGIATEIAGLAWLGDVSGGVPVVEVINHGREWLMTRRLRHGDPTPDDAAVFGSRLARTHAAGASH